MTLATITTLRPVDSIMAELDGWDSAITELDQALKDVAEARDELGRLHWDIELIEAKATLMAEGKNADERKANVTLALHGDPQYRAKVDRQEATKKQLAVAERRIAVTKERCRLLRAAVQALGSVGD